MNQDHKDSSIDKYRVNPVKVTKKRRINNNLTGEDIELLNENQKKKNNVSICDTHEDGA